MKFKDLPNGRLFVYGRRMARQRVLSSDVLIKLHEPLQHRARGAPQPFAVTAVSLQGEHKQPPDEVVVSLVEPAEDLALRVSDGRAFGSVALISGAVYFVWSSITLVHQAELSQLCWPVRPPIVDEAQRIVRNIVGFDGHTYHAEPADRIAIVVVDGSFQVVAESSSRQPPASGNGVSPEATVTSGGLVVVAKIPVFLDPHASPLPSGWAPPKRPR